MLQIALTTNPRNCAVPNDGGTAMRSFQGAWRKRRPGAIHGTRLNLSRVAKRSDGPQGLKTSRSYFTRLPGYD